MTEVIDEVLARGDRLAFGSSGWGRGATATGELSTDVHGRRSGPHRADRTVDEIIVSTLQTTISRWLHQDLPHRIERKVESPVTVITGGREPTVTHVDVSVIR